jgi:threonine dehydrogenase-like Zn-dependent dehydrogenase
MEAVFLDQNGPRLTEHPEPAPSQDTAIVRVHLAGICNTDLELVKGYMKFEGILGHELVGSVVDGPAAWIGARVVAEINFACGRCRACAMGLGRHCPSRRVMGILNADGAFAERVAVPLSNLHRVPDDMTDETAVFSEPLAAAFEILEQVHVDAATDCVVLGDGKLGLLAAQVLYQAGARVLAVGKHESKLEILKRRGIAVTTLDEWKGEVADLVVEATGTAAGFQTAVAATRPRGTLVLKSTAAAGTQLNLAPLVINEITVVGSRCGSFAPALRALRVGGIDVRSLIAHRLSLHDALRGLELAAIPGTLKVLIEP